MVTISAKCEFMRVRIFEINNRITVTVTKDQLYLRNMTFLKYFRKETHYEQSKADGQHIGF